MSRVIYDVIIYDVLQDSWYDTRLAQAATIDYDYIMIIICIIHLNLQYSVLQEL